MSRGCPRMTVSDLVLLPCRSGIVPIMLRLQYNLTNARCFVPCSPHGSSPSRLDYLVCLSYIHLPLVVPGHSNWEEDDDSS